MLQFFNRFAGVIFCVVLYPLKSLLINVGLAGIAVIAAPILWMGLPLFIFSEEITDDHSSLIERWLKAFILPPIVLVMLPFVVVAAFVALITLAIYDVFRMAFLGFMDGAAFGLSLEVLDTLWSKFTRFTSPVQVWNYFSGVASVDSPSSHPWNQSTETYEAMLVETYNEAPNFLKLTQAELLKAEKIAELRVDLKHYNNLFKKLNQLDQAIGSRGNDEFLPDVDVDGKQQPVDDEVITSTPIRQPSLLLKQYYDVALNRWKAVPVSTYIIDQANIEAFQEHCIENNQTFLHPLTREKMEVPNSYNGQKTRHRIHVYEGMANAQELVEAANAIREHLAGLSKPSPQTGVRPGLFSSLFSRNAAPIDDVANNASDASTFQP